MSKHTDNPIPTDSPAYGRRLVKAIRDASATRNVYHFGPKGTQWVTSATYQEDSNCIQINTPRGPVSVHSREWQNLRDSHGRSIAASQAAHGESRAQQSPQPQEGDSRLGQSFKYQGMTYIIRERKEATEYMHPLYVLENVNAEKMCITQDSLNWIFDEIHPQSEQQQGGK